MVFSIENFTGPMDLLLSIVERQNDSIYSINICSVIDQYLEAVQTDGSSMDSLSDFIIFASRLIEIKAYMLLPPDTGDEEAEEEDPAAELERHLQDYKVFKELSCKLRECYKKSGDTIVRPPGSWQSLLDQGLREHMLADALKGITVSDLAAIYRSVMEEKQKRGDPERPKPMKMKKDDAPYAQVKEEVSGYLHRKKTCLFSDIPSCKKGKASKAMSFFSILELSKEGEISIAQDGDNIIIKKLPSSI